MFVIIKKMFVVLLSSIVNASNHITCISKMWDSTYSY